MKKRKKQPSSIRISRGALFGYHAVSNAWLNPERQIRTLYLTEGAARNFEDVLRQSQQQNLKRPTPIIIGKDEIDRILPKGTIHQGLVLDTEDLPETFISDLIVRAEAQERSLILILDQITDPHNVGAILRSACAFGALGIVMQSRHAPDLDGVLAKTASGAAEHVPVAYETNLSRAIEELQQNGFFVYGLDERGEQTVTELAQSNRPEKIALVLGAEGPGIRSLIKKHCDGLVKLPTFGALSSLNVSNAAAVSLYALQAT